MDPAQLAETIKRLEEQNIRLAAQNELLQSLVMRQAAAAPPPAAGAPAAAAPPPPAAAAAGPPPAKKALCPVCNQWRDRSSMARHLAKQHGQESKRTKAAAAAAAAAATPPPPPRSLSPEPVAAPAAAASAPAAAAAAPAPKRGRGRPRKRSLTSEVEESSESEFVPEDSGDEQEPPKKRQRTGPSIPVQAQRSRLNFFPMPESALMAKFKGQLPAMVLAARQEDVDKAMRLIAHGVALATAEETGEPLRAPTAEDVDRKIAKVFDTKGLDRLTACFAESGCADGTLERYLASLETSGVLTFLVAEKRVRPEAPQAVAALKKIYCKRGVMTNKKRCDPMARLEEGFAPDQAELAAYVLVRMTGPDGLVALMEAYLEADAARIVASQFLETVAAVYATVAMSCPAMRPGVWTAMTVKDLMDNLAFDMAPVVARIVAKGTFAEAELAGLSTIVFAFEGDKTARIYGASSIAVTAELKALLVLFVRFRAKALRDSFGVAEPPDLLFVNSAGGRLTNLSTCTRSFTAASVNHINPRTGKPFPKMNMPPNGFRAVQTTAEALAPPADTDRAALLAATQKHTLPVARSAAYTLVDPRERALCDRAALERAKVAFLAGFMTPEQVAKFSM